MKEPNISVGKINISPLSGWKISRPNTVSCLAVETECHKGTNSKFHMLNEMYELESFLYKTNLFYNGTFIQQIFIKYLFHAMYYIKVYKKNHKIEIKGLP